MKRLPSFVKHPGVYLTCVLSMFKSLVDLLCTRVRLRRCKLEKAKPWLPYYRSI